MDTTKHQLIKELLNYGVLALGTISLLGNQEQVKKEQKIYLENLIKIQQDIQEIKNNIFLTKKYND